MAGKNRGVDDILLAVVDGLKGFPDAITAVFPEAVVQTCIVHLLRHSLDFVFYKDRKVVAAALKAIYRAVDAVGGEAALTAFEAGHWGQRYPAIGQSWRRAWAEVVPFYAFPGDVRKILYTTNAIEALNAKRRRAVRARGHFPTDEAAMKLLYLVLNRSEKEWRMGPREWTMAKAQVRRHLRLTLHQGRGRLMFNRPPTHGNPDSPALERHDHRLLLDREDGRMNGLLPIGASVACVRLRHFCTVVWLMPCRPTTTLTLSRSAVSLD